MTLNDALLAATLLQRKAIVYVRQPTPRQMRANLRASVGNTS
jgi:hypothetical protein